MALELLQFHLKLFGARNHSNFSSEVSSLKGWCGASPGASTEVHAIIYKYTANFHAGWESVFALAVTFCMGHSVTQ